MNALVDISNIQIKTERLVLRPFKLDDLEDFYEYAKVDGVGQMAGWAPHKNINESSTILNMFIEGKKTFAIVYNDKVIGSLGIEEYNTKELPSFDNKIGRELGYVLAKDYWGKGLMPEAVKAVIKYCFNELNYDFLACGHFINNTQSMRVQEKCGFKHYKKIKYQTIMGTIEDTWLSILTNEMYNDLVNIHNAKVSINIEEK